jgi:phosphoenolpyruvate phosphomutase
MKNQDNPNILIGVHDPLSALLAEKAGFKMLWASGFGFSTVSGIPDVNLLTLSENLETIRKIINVTTIPVIADCDSGYGDIVMVQRLVREYEKIGVAGICIEDNIYPKRCSFYEGVRRDLATISEHVAKIKVCAEFKKNKNFLVFARTEALIAGYGQKEALERAEAYAKAGADVIVIHSKVKDAGEVLEFAKNWKLDKPLAVIPTTYFNTPLRILVKAGFSYFIYANQLIRSAVGIMESTLIQLKKENKRRKIDDVLPELSHIFSIVGVDKVKELEEKYSY